VQQIITTNKSNKFLFIGDSNTFGYVPFEDLYTHQVESLLRKRGVTNVEVLSVALRGWGTDQELEALKREGIKYHPDVVVYQFDQNDVIDVISPDKNINCDKILKKKVFQYELVKGSLKKIKLSPQIEKNTMEDFLLKSALIYNLNKVRKVYFSNKKKENISVAEKDSVAATKRQRFKNFLKQYPHNPSSSYFLSSTKKDSLALQEAWDLLEALIVEMKAICNNNHAQLVVFPLTSGEIGGREWELSWNRIQTDGLSDFVIREGEKYPIDLNKPLNKITRICQRNNISIIIPRRKYDRFVYDGHANALGNYKMALDVVSFLEEKYGMIIKQEGKE